MTIYATASSPYRMRGRLSTQYGTKMRDTKLTIGTITPGSIRPYGVIIDSRCVADDGRKNNFGILLRERARGWRIGYLIVRERVMRRLERHPDSLETFEPVKGTAVIALASRRERSRPKLFRLDKPVVIKKGVWHDVAAVSKRADIKIFENSEVRTDYCDLKSPISVRS